MADRLDNNSELSSTSRPSSSASSSSSSSTPSASLPIVSLDIPVYSLAYCALEAALTLAEPSSDMVQEALHTLTLSMPFFPPPQLIYGEPWGLSSSCIKTQVACHRNSTFEDALANFPTPLSDLREQMFLRILLQHPCGWSATPSHHLLGPGFRWLNTIFHHLGGLHPILDAVIWPEDAVFLPTTYDPNGPDFLLLVSKARTYYIYNFWDSKLMEAGRNLEEVYNGMKEWKHNKLTSMGGWEGVDNDVEEDEIDEYFPLYKHHEIDRHWVLEHKIPEPPESIGSEYPRPKENESLIIKEWARKHSGTESGTPSHL
jgi:hypothetical protein